MPKKEKKLVGLASLINVQYNAVMKRDNYFAEKIRKIIDEKIQIEVDKEDYDYMMKYYAESK